MYIAGHRNGWHMELEALLDDPNHKILTGDFGGRTDYYEHLYF
jgi:hypothetical protein